MNDIQKSMIAALLLTFFTGAAMANAELGQCIDECTKGPESDEQQECVSDCYDTHQEASLDDDLQRPPSASEMMDGMEALTMMAEGGASCTAEGICDQASAPGLTRVAGSIRIGDPQPICGTDAWACFNGTDDESPMVRDVGIFTIFAYDDPAQRAQ
ncbi:MAG: hypothetical protein ISN28_14565 [Ectothiorhodospiraceae bacterium AqS1]|nr:hypothetical protein [Ectothiorhodospiraceae bacterium AqS1]